MSKSVVVSALFVTGLLLTGCQVDTSKQDEIIESAESDAIYALEIAEKANARIDELEARVDELEATQ
jgi:hypothetical protein